MVIGAWLVMTPFALDVGAGNLATADWGTGWAVVALWLVGAATLRRTRTRRR